MNFGLVSGRDIYAWPYCPVCRLPFMFEKDGPWAFCACGTTEWGYPRPAEWIPDPSVTGELNLQQRVGEWHEATFGPTDRAIISRLQNKLTEERAELDYAILDGDPEDVAEELADMQICLMGIASRYRLNLMAEAEKKFEIVKNRDQKAKGDK